jgi:hypothetical protein
MPMALLHLTGDVNHNEIKVLFQYILALLPLIFLYSSMVCCVFGIFSPLFHFPVYHTSTSTYHITFLPRPTQHLVTPISCSLRGILGDKFSTEEV